MLGLKLIHVSKKNLAAKQYDQVIAKPVDTLLYSRIDVNIMA